MLRNEYLTCMELHKRLKGKIKGSIFIKIENGVINIFINAYRGVTYVKEFEVTEDLDIDILAQLIELEWREFIISKFFHE